MYMPMDDKQSKGFAFIEFHNPDMANAAAEQCAPAHTRSTHARAAAGARPGR